MEADADGQPVVITLRGRRLRVLQVQDTWRIDDEWWRDRPVSRMYYSLLLEDGGMVTVFQDLATSRWAKQDY